MRNTALIILLLLASCRSKAVTVDTTRHADSVSSLRSIAARDLERVEVWETLVMKADTSGKLVPVSREVKTHKEKSSQTETQHDTTLFSSSVEESFRQEEKNPAEATETPRRGFSLFVAGVWVGFSLLVCLLSVFIIKKGMKKWN